MEDDNTSLFLLREGCWFTTLTGKKIVKYPEMPDDPSGRTIIRPGYT